MDIDSLRIKPGERAHLDQRPTIVDPIYASKDDYKSMLKKHVKQLDKLQAKLYADNRWSLLLIFQAMDTAGKDGAIRHVMSGINPQGCQVFSFKHPSATELEHDFLWRTSQSLPERGRIGIFNRSYYEEVLVVRVHPEILDAQNLPQKLADKDSIWKQRYDSINEHEQHLHRNGTRIVKFYLHLSKDEQRRRFLDRIETPSKNWKFSAGDVTERGFWDEYQDAYEQALSATSSEHAPWYAVPADDKKNARLLISQVVVETLKDLKLEYPAVDDERQAELVAARDKLLTEGSASGQA